MTDHTVHTDWSEKVVFATYSDFSAEAQTNFHMSQSVRIGDFVTVSGQTGIDEVGNVPLRLTDEYTNTFDNVRRALGAVGANWSDVYEITSYHVVSPDQPALTDHVTHMVRQLKTVLPEVQPLWTCLGVERLGDEQLRVEIVVRAYTGRHTATVSN